MVFPWFVSMFRGKETRWKAPGSLAESQPPHRRRKFSRRSVRSGRSWENPCTGISVTGNVWWHSHNPESEYPLGNPLEPYENHGKTLGKWWLNQDTLGIFWCFWVNFITTSANDLTVYDGEWKGNHPKMAELFRLVNYSNLPRMTMVYDYGLWFMTMVYDYGLWMFRVIETWN